MLTDSSRRDLLEQMLLIRTFEQRMMVLFERNKLPEFLHLSIGQEAVAVGACTPLRQTDWIVTTHRGHGHVLAKGGDPRAMVAELFGKEQGSCRGVGGSMHLTDPAVGVLCANAIVGASIGLATGAAFSAQYRRTDDVAVAFFGDGAANQGLFHESLNFAALWKLPVVFVCENNGYAEFSAQASQTSVDDIARRAEAYAIPGLTIDGNDVEAVVGAMSEAVARARCGDGPTLLECKTYRVRGHFEGDQQAYKPDGEAEDWRGRDPIAKYRATLEDADVIGPDWMADIVGRIGALLDEAVEEAVANGTTVDAALFTELTYANPLYGVAVAVR
jgi:pyruvate dehydrogenase E1 component alpha subunit